MKNILITGSSQGIGRGIAEYFGKLDYRVFVTYKNNKAMADEVVNTIKDNAGEAINYQVDVMNEESVKDLYKQIETETDSLDVIVNNAAVDYPTNIETCTFDEWKEITRTKIDGNFLCTKYGLELLKKSGNSNLICIMSSMYEKVDPDDPAYCVGTAGIVTFIKAMALSLSKYNIRTNGVGPSEVKTNSKYWEQIGTNEMWEELAAKNPTKRLCTPLDVAKTIEMIVNDKSGMINGNMIYVTGGSHLK